jgi:hypothetical protein
MVASFELPASQPSELMQRLKNDKPFLIGFIIGVFGCLAIPVGGLALILWLVFRAR